MLKRIARILDTGVDLLEVKAQLVMRSLEKVGITWVGYLGACLLLMLGVGTLLAACVVALAPLVGVAWALVIVGAGTLALGGIVMFLCSSNGPIRRRYREEIDRKASEAKESFFDAIQGESTDEAPHEESELHRLAGAVTSNPVAAASAGFALLSVIGVKRTMRLISAGTMLVGLIDSIRSNGVAESKDVHAPFERGAPNVPPGATGDERARSARSPNGQTSNDPRGVRSS